MKSTLLGIRYKALLAVAGLALALMLALVQPLAVSASVRFAVSIAFQAMLVGLIAAALVMSALRWLREIGFDRLALFRVVAITVVFAAIGLVILAVFLQGETDIKTYDASINWLRVLKDRATIGDSIPEYFRQLRASLGEEYNGVAAFPLLLVSYLTGISYRGFCQSVFLVYYPPAALFLALFALRLNQRMSGRKPGVSMLGVCLGIATLSVCFLWPVLNGYVDVSGVLVMALLLNVTLHWNLMQFTWRKNLLVTLLCLAMVLLQRWFVCYLAGFFIAYALVTVADAALRRTLSWRGVAMLLGNLAMIAGLGALVLLCLNPAWLPGLFHAGVGDVYGLARRVRFGDSLMVFARNNGILWMLLALAGAVLLLVSKGSRAIASRLLLAMVIALALFGGMANMGIQYYYLALPTLIIFVCALAEHGAKHAVEAEKPGLLLCTAVICAISFPLSYVESLAPYARLTDGFTPSVRHYPQQNPNYDVARLVTRDLQQIMALDPAYVYVVGDQPLHAEMLKRGFLPEVIDAAPFVLSQHAVDLRDGFPSKAFFAEYLLINKPYQSNYPKVQQVNFQLYDLIENDPLSKAYYREDSRYPTDVGEAILYRKVRPTDRVLVDALKERLCAYYPDNPFVYEPNSFLALLEVLDGAQYTFHEWEDRITLVRPAGGVVRFQISDTEGFETLSFRLRSETAGQTLTVENQRGVLAIQPLDVGEHAVELEIAGSAYVTVSIAEAEETPPTASTIDLLIETESLRQ